MKRRSSVVFISVVGIRSQKIWVVDFVYGAAATYNGNHCTI